MRSSVKSGATISVTSINRDVSNRMSLREKRKRKTANSATMSAVDIGEAAETSDGRHLLPEGTEEAVLGNTRLARQSITVINAGMTIIDKVGIVMVVEEAHQVIVEEMIGVGTDK